MMMLNRKNTVVTAVTLTAVMFIGLWLSGCVTQRHVREIKAEIRAVHTQNTELSEKVARMDSIIAAGEQANSRLRADVSTTVSELHREIQVLLENYNDLMVKLDQMSQQKTYVRLEGSPGAQPPRVTADTVAAPPPEPAIDCGNAYDEAFILVRQGEYDKAVSGFQTFLEHCSDHDYTANAYYWIGECYYSQERFADAIVEFERVINDYKDSPKVGQAMYKLARSQQEMGKTDEAKQTFQKIVEDFAGTLEAEQAKERLKEM